MANFLLVGIVLLMIIVGPFATIWALNHLFNLGIPYDLMSWLAVFWLSAMIYGPSAKK